MTAGTRRNFVWTATAGLAGLLGKPVSATVSNEVGGFKLGLTTWSLKSFQRSLAIKMIQQMQTPYVSIKEFHLPYRSTPEELAAGRKEFEKAGLHIIGGGVINLHEKNESSMRSTSNTLKRVVCP